jgi:hypothetical protein
MEQLDYIPNTFVQQYITTLSGVIVPIDFMALCDDNPFDAILLAQIIYWYRPNKSGKRKLQIYKDGHWWIAKKHSDWYPECRIKERTVRRCLERLQDSKLIIYKVSGFAGMTIPHLRMNWEVFETKIKALQEAIDLKGQLTPEVNQDASDSSERLTPEVSPFDLKGQEQLTPEVNPNTETTTIITTVDSLDSSSDESINSASPVGETAMPESKSIEPSALQAKESPESYAYDFDNNPLSRMAYDNLLTSFDTMKKAVFWLYEHPKVTRKVTHMIAAQVAHQLMGNTKTKAGKAIKGVRKEFAFTEQPATPQEVIAFGIWYKKNKNWIPSQKAEELHEQFTEYRNLPYHGTLLELAQMELHQLLKIRVGAPFPKHETANLVDASEVDALLTDMASALKARQQEIHDAWYEKHAEDIKWHQANARKLSALPSQRQGWLNL